MKLKRQEQKDDDKNKTYRLLAHPINKLTMLQISIPTPIPNRRMIGTTAKLPENKRKQFSD